MDWIETKVDVRYQETDQMGVVYHGNYLVWFEIGRTKYIDHLGFKYAEMEEEGILSPVINVNASYKQAIRFGESALIKTRLKHYDSVRVIYAYEILNEQNELAVSGETEHAFVNKSNFKPTLLRKANKQWHEAFMAKVSEKE